MYRLLIADDEALEREGLELTVTRLMPGMFEIFHAENGRVAIQCAEQHRPDIVFMDIKMPGIEGLEALRQMKEHNPRMKMVLVSAYDYFSYAKQALVLGVKEYLLKPAKKEQIAVLLQRLIAELEAEEEKRGEELKQAEKLSQVMPIVENEAAFALMLGAQAGANPDEALDMLGLRAERGCAVVLSCREEAGGEYAVKWYDAVKNFAKSRYACIVSPIVSGRMAIFLLQDEKEPAGVELTRDRVELWAGGVCAFVWNQFGLRPSCGIGSLLAGTEGMHRSFREACLAADAKGPAAVRHYEDSAAALPAGLFFGPDAQMEMEKIRLERVRQTQNAVERAKRWIDERFCEEISMEQAAEFSSLSPFYFSKMFKLHIGETFIDYLTGLRIQKAKQLIRGGDLSLKEVCYEVGYRDPNYFSRVFKKVTGRSPKEFRDYPG